jgi:hypothetical protein
MRIAGAILFIFGLLISLSIVGAVFGVPMMFVGALMMVFGGRRKTIITNVVQVSNNAGAPQLSLDANDRYDRQSSRREPLLRSGFSEPASVPDRRPATAQIPKAPEFEPTYDHMEFTDVRTQLSQDSKRILALAKDDGFDVRARPESIILKKGEFQEALRSNDEVYEFGRLHGYQ